MKIRGLGEVEVLSRSDHAGMPMVYVHRPMDGFGFWMREDDFNADIASERRRRWVDVCAPICIVIIVLCLLFWPRSAEASPFSTATRTQSVSWPVRIVWPIIWTRNLRAGSEV